MPKTVILSSARTPIGKLGGAFASIDATELGASAINAALERAEVAPDDVQHVVMGQVLQAGQGQIPSRQAQVKAGIPKEVSSETINKVCASGIRSAALLDTAIRVGDLEVGVGGGMESMSKAPYMLKEARFGFRMGDGKAIDEMIHDGLTNPCAGKHMAQEASEVAAELEVTRPDMDRWALRSHQLVIKATDEGRLTEEIVPITVKGKKGDTVVEVDEAPRRDASLEALAKLPPIFVKDGSHTAGNSPGVNDGAANQAFCRNGSWVSDAYNGAVLNMVVADSCGDSNAWCRDDPYHLDLAKASLDRFTKNGSPVGSLLPDHYNNRHISWSFISAPNYSGDLQIGFLQGAQQWWPAIAVSHLPNGIHGVQFFASGSWQNGQMDSDMGDDYIIGPTTGAGTAGTQYQIRVIDASGNLANNGEIYSFTLPAGCSTGCSAPYTPITYTSSPGGGSPSPSPSPSGSPSPSSSPTPSPGPSPSPTGTGSPSTCALTASVVNSWPGGYQVQFTVANTGTVPGTGWTAGFSFGDSAETIASYWSATVSQSGTAVSASTASSDGAVPASGSVTRTPGSPSGGADMGKVGPTSTSTS